MSLEKLARLKDDLDHGDEAYTIVVWAAGDPPKFGYSVRQTLLQLIRIAEAAERVAGHLTLGEYLDSGAEADEIGLLDLEAELGVFGG